jgi:tetratricopeptide (TPR) repeat protein
MTTLASTVWDVERNAAEAESLYREALVIRRQTLGENHPDVAWTLYNFAYMEMEKGDYAEAERLAGEALEKRGATLPDEHPMVASLLQVAGRCRMARGDAAGAEPLLRESLALRKAALPPGHWLLAVSESVLGECLGLLGRSSEAEALLKRGFESLEGSRGPDNARTREAAERLAALYERAGNPEAARRLREGKEKGGAEAPPVESRVRKP